MAAVVAVRKGQTDMLYQGEHGGEGGSYMYISGAPMGG